MSEKNPKQPQKPSQKFEPPTTKRRRKRRQKNSDTTNSAKKPQAPRRKRPQTPLGQLSKAFVACGRCSFFFSGYWSLVGQPRMEAVAQMQADNWLTLPFEAGVPLLLEKSYGTDILSDVVRYEGSCKQCRRVFEYAVPFLEDGTLSDESPTLRIQVLPRMRQAPAIPSDLLLDED